MEAYKWLLLVLVHFCGANALLEVVEPARHSPIAGVGAFSEDNGGYEAALDQDVETKRDLEPEEIDDNIFEMLRQSHWPSQYHQVRKHQQSKQHRHGKKNHQRSGPMPPRSPRLYDSL